MNVKLFKLKCLTNLHVGNGDVNFNVVDNEVEKDPINHYPIINASGVKGALRDFFTGKNVAQDTIDQIFGGKPKKGDDASDSSAGQVKLLSAWMLARPLRATAGGRAYYLVTTPAAVEQFRSITENLGVAGGLSDAKELSEDLANAQAENRALNKWYTFDDEALFEMSDTNFGDISLPVIARNSTGAVNRQNLWYEEFVPHESVFYFFAVSDDRTLLETFAKELDGEVVQFGGNASIGCGLCKVTEQKGG
ncbi:MAG: RAMP superfamily CRISPR-associated protein [Clostridiales bacterium]|nr:RAMP superfamily CRISPR-associated protein [Clostridiales bacterium]